MTDEDIGDLQSLSMSEKKLLQLCGNALLGEPIGSLEIALSSDLIISALKRDVAPLLFVYSEYLSPGLREQVEEAGRTCSARFYRLLQLTIYVQSILEKADVKTVVLKGIDAASKYPIPEYRSFGDIDIFLIRKADMSIARNLLCEAGFIVNKKQNSKHHVSFVSNEGIEIELHSDILRPSGNESYDKRINLFFHDESIRVEKELFGLKYWALGDAQNCLYLMLHMVQHLVNSGFGIKLLCDWFAFVNIGISDSALAEYKRISREYEIDIFSDYITEICVSFMGISEKKTQLFRNETVRLDKTTINWLMKDIFEAERYGENDRSRLVCVNNKRFIGLFVAFHKQTKYYYPNATKFFFVLPILWGITLMRFLHNNLHNRKTSSRLIINKALMRGQLINGLGIKI